MRIQHNISALYASHNLKRAENAISKSIARLSSGYRINCAADDPAGLAVSERMRAQINGLKQAEDNVQNDISLVQTAEGGLTSINNILQRMNTLAVESANGTYQNDTDRRNLQKEFTALKSEIDRTSTSTNFNEINLLDGSLSETGSSIAASAAVNIPGVPAAHTTRAEENIYSTTISPDVAANAASAYTIHYKTADGTAKSLQISAVIGNDKRSITYSDGTKVVGLSADATAKDVAGGLATALSADHDFSSAFQVDTPTSAKITIHAKTSGTNGETLVGITENKAAGTTGLAFHEDQVGTNAYSTYDLNKIAAYNGTNVSSSVFTVNGQKFAFVKSGTDTSGLGSDVNTVFIANANATGGEISSMSALINNKTGLATAPTALNATTVDFKSGTSAKTTSGKGISFQVGPDNKADQCISLTIGDMSTKGLGISNISIATQADARAAISAIKTALNTVSSARADLGATMNELEYTANNLSTMRENLTAAESKIRDVDISDEYVEYSKNLILAQIATAMLAQSNARQKDILTLLNSGRSSS